MTNGIKQNLLSEILKPSKAVKFLQTDETSRTAFLKILSNQKETAELEGEKHIYDYVIPAFEKMDEALFVVFIDACKPASQRNKITGVNLVKQVKAVGNRPSISSDAFKLYKEAGLPSPFTFVTDEAPANK